MEILQLKYFCSAAETENFSKTAEIFSVPPSDISQCIKRLEKELEVSLFLRGPNSICLNEYGKQFYLKVNRALKLIEEAEFEMKDSENFGIIKILISTNRNIVMNVIEKYKKIYNNVVIEISHDMPKNVDDFDIIIADDDFNKSTFERELIISENFALAVKKDNPLADKAEITANDLKNEPFVCMNKGTSFYSSTLKIGNMMNFTPNIAINSDDPFYVRKCVEFGLGVTFMPMHSWEGLFSDNVVLKTINNFKRNTYAYISKNKYMKKCTKEFLKMLVFECR